MGNAYVCPISGATGKGDGVMKVEVPFEGGKVDVSIFEKAGPHFHQVGCAPEVAEKIRSALAAVLPAAKKGEKKG